MEKKSYLFLVFSFFVRIFDFEFLPILSQRKQVQKLPLFHIITIIVRHFHSSDSSTPENTWQKHVRQFFFIFALRKLVNFIFFEVIFVNEVQWAPHFAPRAPFYYLTAVTSIWVLVIFLDLCIKQENIYLQWNQWNFANDPRLFHVYLQSRNFPFFLYVNGSSKICAQSKKLLTGAFLINFSRHRDFFQILRD